MEVDSTRATFLSGDRINLRPLLSQDIPLLVEWLNDEETRHTLMRFTPMTPAIEEEWLKKIEKEYNSRAPGQLVFGIALPDGQLIGTIGLHDINWINRTAVTGTTIGPKEYRQKGYATEAKMLLLQFAFLRLDLFKIYSAVIAFNGDSLRYAARCGYVEEARFKGDHVRDGVRHDEVILAVYKERWLEARDLWRQAQATQSRT